MNTKCLLSRKAVSIIAIADRKTIIPSPSSRQLFVLAPEQRAMRQRHRFSERFDLAGAEPEKAFAYAPPAIRLGILDVACECGVPLGVLRAVLRLEFRKPSQGGVSGADLWEEARTLVQQSDWPSVYDAAEALYDLVAREDPDRALRFEIELNRLFRSERVPFEMIQGQMFPTHAIPSEGVAISLPRSPPSVAPADVGQTPDVSEASLDPSTDREVSRASLLTRASLTTRAVLDWLIGIAERPGFQTLVRGMARVLRLFFGNGVLR
jgi:hypothetical protein